MPESRKISKPEESHQKHDVTQNPVSVFHQQFYQPIILQLQRIVLHTIILSETKISNNAAAIYIIIPTPLFFIQIPGRLDLV